MNPTEEAAAMWRNGITNTIGIVDLLRGKYANKIKKSKVLAEFDQELSQVLEVWFKASRAAKPENYQDAEHFYLFHDWVQ